MPFQLGFKIATQASEIPHTTKWRSFLVHSCNPTILYCIDDDPRRHILCCESRVSYGLLTCLTLTAGIALKKTSVHGSATIILSLLLVTRIQQIISCFESQDIR